MKHARHITAPKIDAVIERIRSYRRHRSWSLNKFATEAGLPWSVVQNMDEPDWSPSLATLRKAEGVIPDDFSPPKGSAPPAPRDCAA